VIPGAKTRDFNWVEQAAIDQYYVGGEGGYDNGTHCEGRVMMEIFSVFFRDRILLPPKNFSSLLSGLIQSPIQKWALDVGFMETISPERWNEAMAVVDELGGVDYEDLANLVAAYGVEFTTPCLEILKCMQGKILAAIMRLIISDPYYWGGGQPDLILWDTKSKSVCFAEVKGPGDQLSPRQRYWLAYLRDSGATAEVCWVVDEPKEKPVRKRDTETMTVRSTKVKLKKVKTVITINEIEPIILISQTDESPETSSPQF
jgi:Fanconi-associated nuclease 1